MRVERDEQERQRLDRNARAAVDGRVVGEGPDSEPARDVLVLAQGVRKLLLGAHLAHV